jgi:heme exporter protein D
MDFGATFGFAYYLSLAYPIVIIASVIMATICLIRIAGHLRSVARSLANIEQSLRQNKSSQ